MRYHFAELGHIMEPDPLRRQNSRKSFSGFRAHLVEHIACVTSGYLPIFLSNITIEDSTTMDVRRISSRHRSRSPYRLPHNHRPHRRKRSSSPLKGQPLPFQAQPLDKRDSATYQPLLASYLDIQKGLALEELDANEVKGRWKGFVKKWYVFYDQGRFRGPGIPLDELTALTCGGTVESSRMVGTSLQFYRKLLHLRNMRKPL